MFLFGSGCIVITQITTLEGMILRFLVHSENEREASESASKF